MFLSWLLECFSPHVELAGYSLEHPVYRHVNMRIQTSPTSAVAAEQVLAESLELTKDIFSNISLAMKECMQEDKEKRMND